MSCPTLITELRSQGYRLTPQREMIIEAIAHAERHVTADEVLEQVHTHTSAINIATVYRTLDLLVDLGLVSRIDLGDSRVTYASQLHGSHCHLVCRRCGQVIEAEHDLVAPLEQQLEKQHEFTAYLWHIAISGLCAACRNHDGT